MNAQLADHKLISLCVSKVLQNISKGESTFFIGSFDPEIVFRSTISTYLQILKDSTQSNPVKKHFEYGDYVRFNDKHFLIYDGESSSGGTAFKTADGRIVIDDMLTDLIEKADQYSKIAPTKKVMGDLGRLKNEVPVIRRLLNIPSETDVVSAKPGFIYFGNSNRIKGIIENDKFYNYRLNEILSIGRVKHDLTTLDILTGARNEADIQLVSDTIILESFIMSNPQMENFVFINSNFITISDIDVIDRLIHNDHPLFIFGQYPNIELNLLIQSKVPNCIILDKESISDFTTSIYNNRVGSIDHRLITTLNREIQYEIIESDTIEDLLEDLNSLRPIISDTNRDLQNLLIHYFSRMNMVNADIYSLNENQYSKYNDKVSQILEKQHLYLSKDEFDNLINLDGRMNNYFNKTAEIHQLKIDAIENYITENRIRQPIVIYSKLFTSIEGVRVNPSNNHLLISDIRLLSDLNATTLFIVSPPTERQFLQLGLGNIAPDSIVYVLFHNEYRKILRSNSEPLSRIEELFRSGKSFSGETPKIFLPRQLITIPIIRRKERPQENIFEQKDSLDEEIVAQSIRQYESQTDSAPARKISFIDGFFMFATETHNFHKVSVRLSKGARIKIRKIKFSKIKVGDVIATLETEHEIITSSANQLMIADGKADLITFVGIWRDALINHYNKIGKLETFIEQLHTVGIIHSKITIRSWLSNPYLIGPQDLQEIDRIAELTEDRDLNDNLEHIKKSIKKVRGYHKSAGSMLRRELIAYLESYDYDDISESLIEGNNFHTKHEKLGAIQLSMIQEVSNESKDIDNGYINRMLE